MIRPATEQDVPAILDLVVAAGMFTREETPLVAGLYEEHFGGADGHVSVVDEHDGAPVAVAHARPLEAADGVHDLTMIAVAPGRQRGGHGAALLAHVEAELRAAGRRLLLVETSSTPAYDRARAFYLAQGYDEEARIRDYWTDGDDMVLFRKALVGR